MKWFGDSWDSEVCKHGTEAEPPIGEACMLCSKAIEDGDQGFLVPHVHGEQGEPGESPWHLGCLIRAVIDPSGDGPDVLKEGKPHAKSTLRIPIGEMVDLGDSICAEHFSEEADLTSNPAAVGTSLAAWYLAGSRVHGKFPTALAMAVGASSALLMQGLSEPAVLLVLSSAMKQSVGFLEEAPDKREGKNDQAAAPNP